jgi:serine/threonine protein kinase
MVVSDFYFLPLDSAPALVGWEVLAQLSAALKVLHKEGIVHRDLKPENILVDPSSHSLRLIDWGSSADLFAPALGKGSAARAVPGVLACSPLYMAPEAAVDQHGDQRAYDAYSVGVVVLRLCLSEHLSDQKHLASWVAQFEQANHNLDKWLQVTHGLFFCILQL